ncbi:glycosyltransferase [Devosia sp. 2618]|uniref:glycosyltransferase n=1 Tax=Devosia sp. 2618 TaxID=3156454 RepID=UPI00339AE7ED
MSDAVELVKAILAEDQQSDAVALAVLDAALEREVDVLLYCAVTLGLGEAIVMERAAVWAGYGYFDRVPRHVKGVTVPARLEALAEVRLFRVTMLDREVAFAAPDFLGVIRLRQALIAKPSLRQTICLVPETALRDFLTEAAAPALIDAARQGLARRWPYACAQLELTILARWGFVAGMGLLVALVLIAPYLMQLWLLPLVMCILVLPALIRIAALLTPPRKIPEMHRPADEDLPIYSVMIPLHNEALMVPQLFAAMRALDYPAERLDIKFVVEAQSTWTVNAVRAQLGDPRFTLVAVPDAAPRTKPKALDFALPLCRGEHVVVYDAEDIPDPDQLWKAVVRFRDNPDIVCLQAHLVIDNGRRNWLAALFTGEYAGLFTVLLPALARWRLPMPLGGTSNHFRTNVLRELGGWDAYNVTEDADLGVRLARQRLRVDVLASRTRETAPAMLAPWMGQRTRWMKGWMQTFIVHNRNPGLLCKQMGLRSFLAFQILVIGMITAPVLHCAFAVMVVVHLILGALGVGDWPWGVFYIWVLIIGYGSAFATSWLGLARLGKTHLLGQQLLLPLYWLLMGFATFRAGHELLVRPFHWFKTPHRPAATEVARRRRKARRRIFGGLRIS